MNGRNFDREMLETAKREQAAGNKPKLLLHACCAPCASASVERVKEYFAVTLYFYNPNIDGIAEYEKRRAEAERLSCIMGVDFFAEEFRPEEYFDAVKGLEKEPEGGARCEKCFLLRLGKTAEYAEKNGFDYFSTTLTLGPMKNSRKVNEAGFIAQEGKAVKFLPCDFKKRDGYLRSLELSELYSLYRQNYCGCVFSKNK